VFVDQIEDQRAQGEVLAPALEELDALGLGLVGAHGVQQDVVLLALTGQARRPVGLARVVDHLTAAGVDELGELGHVGRRADGAGVVAIVLEQLKGDHSDPVAVAVDEHTLPVRLHTTHTTHTTRPRSGEMGETENRNESCERKR
jgi:hypothetical protein